MAERQAELVRGTPGRDGAFGLLFLDGAPVAVTCERSYPVVESKPDGLQFVKIPPGVYRCERTWFQRGAYETFEITGVTGHSRLLFHCGNSETDSEGCVLVGRRFGVIDHRPAVLESSVAFSMWMYALRGVPSFRLEVRQP